jgi:hypothetical protein
LRVSGPAPAANVTGAPVISATSFAIVRTWTTSSSRPTLNAWSRTTAAGASSTARNAREMSSMCTSGRHGDPSDCNRTSPCVKAVPVSELTTMSARSRGEDP